MAERPSRVPFFVGIAFVLMVVAVVYVTREDDAAMPPHEPATSATSAPMRPPLGQRPSMLRPPIPPRDVKPAPAAASPTSPPSGAPVASTSSGGAGAGGSEPASNGAGPAEPAQQPESHASIDKEDVRSVIKQLAPQFRDCYEQGLAHDPKLGGGRVTVEFTLKRDVTMGSIPAEGSIADSTLNAPLVEACILDKLRAAKFAELKGEGTVKVRYPFVFNASADAGP